MKSLGRSTALQRIALFVALAIAGLVGATRQPALAAARDRAHRLETTEHRYYDSNHRLHIDIRIRHIPLHLRAERPSARGGGRRSHSHARGDSVETQVAAPVAEPAAVEPDAGALNAGDTPSGFFTAPGYGPPLPTTAHPVLPMPLAP